MILAICILGWLLLNTWVGLVCITLHTFIEKDDLWSFLLVSIFSYPIMFCVAKLAFKLEQYMFERRLKKNRK